MSIDQKLVDDLLDATERVLMTVTFERETEPFYALKNLARARRRVCYALGRSPSLDADELKGELILIELLRSSVLMLEQSEHQIRTTFRITCGKATGGSDAAHQRCDHSDQGAGSPDGGISWDGQGLI